MKLKGLRAFMIVVWGGFRLGGFLWIR